MIQFRKPAVREFGEAPVGRIHLYENEFCEFVNVLATSKTRLDPSCR